MGGGRCIATKVDMGRRVSSEAGRARAVREYPNAGWLSGGAVITVRFGAFMGQLDASIDTLTFPSLQREFGTPLVGVQWSRCPRT
ncbi:hypothetical protein rerp_60540 [Rhodococcus erythropolis]|nr:hypothetical protein rerp_60540 [Rhodococcus erythropolis]